MRDGEKRNQEIKKQKRKGKKKGGGMGERMKKIQEETLNRGERGCP